MHSARALRRPAAFIVALAMRDAAPAEAAEVALAIFIADARGGRAIARILIGADTSFSALAIIIAEATLDAAIDADLTGRAIVLALTLDGPALP